MPNTESYKNKFLIIIAGPTAVGKTSLSIQLAKAYNAEIFSADSRQLYLEMNIGTAKPSKEELAEVKHHFINHIPINQSYSVGQYEIELKAKLIDYFQIRDVAIICGGTGLYIRALMDGLDEFPEIPEEISDYYEDAYNKNGISWLQKELETKDATYYNKVDHHNHRRLMRALCVIDVSGVTYSSLLLKKENNKLPYETIPILLEAPRPLLYERINDRVDEMMQLGLQEEAFGLHPYRGLRSLETVGYQELFDFFENKTDLKSAVELIKQNSRRYAKRQMTWFRKYGEWTNFDQGSSDQIKAFIKEQLSKRHKSS